MEEVKDELVICSRCNGNACYKQYIPESNVTTWMCFGCGFTTSTLMVEGTDAFKQTLDSLPNLYRDLMFVDSEGKHWFPATITVPSKGIVFCEGTSVSDWRWAAQRMTPINEDEQHKFPGQKHKMDKNKKFYYDQDQFMNALEVIEFYNLVNA